MRDVLRIKKLRKLLNLTTSDNDHEALSSIRVANKLLSDSGLTWCQVLNFQPETETEPETEYSNEYIEVGDMLDHILNRKLGRGTRNFLESIYDQFKKQGYLSEKQLAVILDIYNKS